MPFCPTCKKEYPMGTTICVDCNISLIDNKSNDMVSFVSMPKQDVAERFLAFMKEHGIEGAYEYGMRDEVYRIFVNKDDKKNAMKCFISFQAAEKRRSSGDTSDTVNEPTPGFTPPAVEEPVFTAPQPVAEAAPAESSIPATNATILNAFSEVPVFTAPAPEEVPVAAPEAPVVETTSENAVYEEHIEEQKAYIESEPDVSVTAEAIEQTVSEAPAVEVSVDTTPAEVPEEVSSPVIEEETVEEIPTPVSDTAYQVQAPVEDPVKEEDSIEIKPASPLKKQPVNEKIPVTVEDSSSDDSDSEEPPIEFMANAATRKKGFSFLRPNKKEEPKQEDSSDSPVFEAKKPQKKHATLYEEMTKNETAALQNEEAESNEDDSTAFTPKRPLTAYQFEKKQEENLANYIQQHASSAYEAVENAAEENEEPVEEVKMSFSDYQQPYVVPSDKVEDQQPIFSDPSKQIDWSNSNASEDNAEESENSSEESDVLSDDTAITDEVPEESAEEVSASELEIPSETIENEEDTSDDEDTDEDDDDSDEDEYDDSDDDEDDSDEDDSDDEEDDSDDDEDDEEVSEDTSEDTVTASEDEIDETSSEEPIFVEVERVTSDELDEDKIIDAPVVTEFKPAEPKSTKKTENESYFSPVNNAQDPIDYVQPEEKKTESVPDAFSDFLANFKKASMSKNQKKQDNASRAADTIASVSVKPVAVPEQINKATKKPETVVKPVITPESSPFEAPEETSNTVIEDIIPDGYSKKETFEFESIPSRPTDIQDTKIKVSVDNDIIEEVIETNPKLENIPEISQSSSFANPEKPADSSNFAAVGSNKNFSVAPNDALLDNEFHGFVPDYSSNEEELARAEAAAPTALDEFKKSVEARKQEVEAINAQAKKEQIRQANLVKELTNGQKIVFEDTDELDNYAGFVPDYTPNTNNEEEFDFYKPHQVSSYSKYKKNNKANSSESVANIESFMRLTSDDEVENLFISHVPSSSKRTLQPQEIKNSQFILSISGKRLTKLFNSWMMLNITSKTVHEFEKEDSSDEENYMLKLEGMKKLLIENFGDINEVFLDNLVQKYYSKFLEE